MYLSSVTSCHKMFATAFDTIGGKSRIASRKICLCPLHKTISTRSVFHLCTKITSSLMLLGTNKRKLLSCVDCGRFFMRQSVALLSFWQNSSASDHFREANVGERVKLQSRRALLKQFAPQYREASSVQKRVQLDAFTQTNG